MKMNTTWQPPVTVPDEVIQWMRAHASKSAFLASMLDLNRRHGGITQNQLDMVLAEIAKAEGRK
jgi:hypothetical protein